MLLYCRRFSTRIQQCHVTSSSGNGSVDVLPAVSDSIDDSHMLFSNPMAKGYRALGTAITGKPVYVIDRAFHNFHFMRRAQLLS